METALKGNKSIGAFGEDLACRYLTKKGYRIVQRNFTCPIGEIDIIAYKDKVTVFIEVKTRRSQGDPLLSITSQKQRKLTKLATYYLETRKIDGDARFDVIGINLENKTAIEHIENAFIMI